MTTNESTEILVPTLSPETIPAPDMRGISEKLTTYNFGAMLEHRVTDPDSAKAADTFRDLANDFIASVEATLNPAISTWHQGHKRLTGVRAKLLTVPQQAIDHLRRERVAYTDRCNRERAELERRIREEREAAARAQAEAERAAAAQNAMPWEVEALMQEPITVEVPPVFIAPLEQDTSFTTRRKPLTYKVTDLQTLIKSIAAKSDENPELLTLLSVVPSEMNKLVRRYGESVSKYLPGLEAEKGTTGQWK